MTGLWLDLLGQTLVYGGLGWVLYVFVRIGARYWLRPSCVLMCLDCDGRGWYRGWEGVIVPCPTCGSSGAVEDEEHPYDPDRQRDWEIADEMGAY